MNSTTGTSLDDIATSLVELRQAGAHQCDPVRFHYLETLCRRSQDQSPTVAAPLTAKLQQALAAYQQQVQQLKEQHTSVAASATNTVSSSGLGELLTALSVQSEAVAITPETSATQGTARITTRGGAAPAELKSVRYFRDSWAKLGVEQRVAQYFIAYADSLLWLQQAVNSLPSKKPVAESSGDGEKKRKTSRAKAR